jgi:hypothetical protein
VNGGAIETGGSLQFFDNRAGTVGSLTSGDGIFSFAGTGVLAVGDTFTYIASTFTIPVGAVAAFNPLANQTFTGDVFWSTTTGVRLSGNVALVPEPSSALLGLCGQPTQA